MAAYISVFTSDCLNLLSLKRYLYDPIPNLNPLAFVSSKLNITVFIIPALYVLTTIISMKLNLSMNNKNKNEKLITDGENKEKINEEENPMIQANKSMSYMMPIMSVSIALIAPLGLALYWLVNNILMIAERLVLNRFVKDEEENENV